MTACYAYDRKKFTDKRIEWGDGLIGTCAQEKGTIHLTNLPDNYVSITSGLGKATPKSLLIVPLIINEQVHGVIELASFNTFEKFEVDFVEKSCRKHSFNPINSKNKYPNCTTSAGIKRTSRNSGYSGRTDEAKHGRASGQHRKKLPGKTRSLLLLPIQLTTP